MILYYINVGGKEKEVIYTVYQHRNLKNGKSYIGMTSQEPKYRWNNGKGYQNNSKMWNDIQESDWNTAWEHNILGKFENEQEALNIEEMFIWLFDSTNDGYNTSSYGNNYYKRSEETIKKMSEAHTGEKNHMFGKHHSEETRNKMSEAQTGEKNPMFGKHHSEETRNKMSEAQTGEKSHWYGKHPSEETKNRISESMSGEKNPMYGKHHSEESKKKIRENTPSKPVLQFSKDGEFIAEYPSTGEAGRQTGCIQQSICACCNGKRKSCGGFIWKYKKI